jgi:hypothetical protein
MGSRICWLIALVAIGIAPDLCFAQASASDRDALVRVATELSAKGVPLAPLINKVNEGLAKGAAPQRIEAVVRQMAMHLETADRLLRETDPSSARSEGAVTLLAEAFGGGVTLEETRELNRQTQVQGKPRVPTDMLASAAKGLSFIKEARLPVTDGIAVIAEGVRQGFRPHQVLDLGREVRRRESDFRAGRATLRALRDAIARGERPEQLFRDARTEAIERPSATRPDPVTERPQRERPQRPDPPQRPERPETPQRPEVTRPERPGGARSQ